MKRLMTAVLVALVLGAVAPHAQEPDRLFKAAMNTELVDGNLTAAIELYKKVAEGSNRALAAQALVRMAECYQKLGDSQARTIYARIVREFSDRKEEAALASARLGSTVAAANVKRDRAVWTGPGVDLSGRVSPDGRWITSVDWGTVPARLMIRDVAANVSRPLTPAGQFAQWSAISRDGKQIVYESGENDRPVIRIAALPENGYLQPRQFVLENVAGFNSFDWSPDGKWIATSFLRTDGTGEIGLVSVSDGSFRRLKSVDRSVLNTLRNLTSILFSPDGKYLAYDRPHTGTIQQKDVFLLAVDDGRDIPAVVHSANDAVMGWSPDGTQLLFRSNRTGSWALWAQPFADGAARGTPELLRSDIGPSVPLGVTTSGALYLFKNDVGTRDIAIAPIDLEAGRLLGPPVSLPQGFLGGATNPTWSPDGRFLSYPVRCDEGCLAIRSVATGQVRRLAPTMTNVAGHRWSSDGRSILAVGADGMGRPGIFQIDVQSGEATPVMSELGGPLAGWSLDRTKVYFSRGEDVVVERDVASGSERVVHRVAGSRGLNLPQLSPDGRYVAGYDVGGASDPSTRRLLLLPVAGGQPRELLTFTQPPGQGSGPWQWTPDSSAVIAMMNPFSRSDRGLWQVPVTGGGPRKLDIDPGIWMEDSRGGGDRGFSVSPDGRSIAFQIGRSGAEVWALENFLPNTSAAVRR